MHEVKRFFIFHSAYLVFTASLLYMSVCARLKDFRNMHYTKTLKVFSLKTKAVVCETVDVF